MIALFGGLAHGMNLIACREDTQHRSASSVPPDERESATDPSELGQSRPNLEGVESRDAFVPVFQSVVVQEGPTPPQIEEQVA